MSKIQMKILLNDFLSQIPEGRELAFLRNIEARIKEKKFIEHKNYNVFKSLITESLRLYEQK